MKVSKYNASKILPHLVIIGGGFGGLTVAKALKNAPIKITLVDCQNHHLFQPLLYQVASAVLSPGDIAIPLRWVLRKQANTKILLAVVIYAQDTDNYTIFAISTLSSDKENNKLCLKRIENYQND